MTTKATTTWREDTFERELLRLIPYLKRFYTGKVPPDDVDDLVQETLFRVWRARAAHDPTRDLKIWLAAIARNLVAEYYRTKSRRVSTVSLEELFRDDPMEEVSAISIDVVDDRYNPVKIMEQTCYSDEIEEALESLDELSRRLILRVGEGDGSSLKEIANEFGMQPGSLRSRLYRIRRKLRSFLEKKKWNH